MIRAFLRSNKVDLVCLQETKIQDMFVGVVRNLGVGRFSDRGALNFEGAWEVLLFFGITEFFRCNVWKLGGFLSLASSETWRIMLNGAS